jgi:hypothetical protein
MGAMRAIAMLAIVSIGACAAQETVIFSEGFEAGPDGIAEAGWRLGADATIEAGEAPEGEFLLRCACGEPAVRSSATGPAIAVKPRTGYVARCRFRVEGSGHLTFGIMNPDASFLVSKDTYVGQREHWDEVVLPFRTRDQETIQVNCARRYGRGSLLFDAVELVEDDSVRVGDVSAAPNPVPKPTPRERARGFIVSSRHWLAQTHPRLHPTRNEVTDVLRCTLAPGEYEPVAVSLTALRPLTGMQVRLAGDFTGPSGAIIPASEVQLGVIRTMKRWLTNAAPLRPGQCYERRSMFIFPMTPTDIAQHRTQRFWLTVRAPEGTRPGGYQGAVTVLEGGEERARLDMRVRVLPIELPEPEVTYGMYYRHTEQFDEFKSDEFFQRCMTDMRAHGCNSMSVYADVERKLADGTYEIALDNADKRLGLPHQMQMMDAAGLLSPEHPLLFLARGTGDGNFYNEDKLVAAADELRRAQGWPELLFYLVDEPSPAQYERAKQLNDIVHRVSGVRTTTAMGLPGELAEYYDVWIVSESVADRDEVQTRAREVGAEVWTYNCTRNGAQPRNDRFFTGLYMWSAALKGNWQWCYVEKASGRVGDDGEIEYGLPGYGDPWRYSYVAPGPDANYPTIGWEARREGIDDYRYLQALREAVEAAAQSGRSKLRERAAKARAFLAEVRVRGQRPDQPLPASQIDRVYLHITKPELGPADYDEIRRQAAEWIIKLTG